MGLITRFFGKSKSSKKAQNILNTLSSPTSNTPSSRFSKLGSFLTGKSTRHRKRHGGKRRGTKRRRRH